MGTSARLKAIADALATKPGSESDASPPATVVASSSSFASGPPRRIEGTEQTRVTVRPRPFTCISNLPRASGPTPSQVDRNQRLKDIQQGLALARKDVVTVKPETPSKCAPTSRPSLKRPSSSAPGAEPQAKRPKLPPVDAPVLGSGIDHQPAATPKPYPSTAPPTVVATAATSSSSNAGRSKKVREFK